MRYWPSARPRWRDIDRVLMDLELTSFPSIRTRKWLIYLAILTEQVWSKYPTWIRIENDLFISELWEREPAVKARLRNSLDRLKTKAIWNVPVMINKRQPSQLNSIKYPHKLPRGAFRKQISTFWTKWMPENTPKVHSKWLKWPHFYNVSLSFLCLDCVMPLFATARRQCPKITNFVSPL